MQLLSSWPYTALYINIILCLHLLVYSLKTYTMTTLPSPSLLFILPNLKFSKTRAQCVNGLLCIHPKCTVKFSSRVNAFTLVANPTTRQVITLPLDQSIDKDFASQLILDTTLIKMSSKFLAWLCIKVVLIMRSRFSLWHFMEGYFS